MNPLEKILNFSINNKFFVIILTILMIAIGVMNLQKLTIDAVPDITNVQVQINSVADGYSPLEVEQRVTYPIETIMAGLPKLDYTRSISRFGLSQVTVVFNEETDIYFARQLVSERINEVKGSLPQGIEPVMGPISTGLGEIFMWIVDATKELKEQWGEEETFRQMREIQDWVIKPQLRNVKGVTEVNTIGGYERMYQVAPDPSKLLAYNLTLQDILSALERNNENIGAGYIEKNGEQYLVRIPGQVKEFNEIEDILVKNVRDVPIYIKNIGDIGYGKELRTGAGLFEGDERVVGTVFMLMGENSKAVASRVSAKIAEINKSLPQGVEIKVVYDRNTLVDKTIKTVQGNLFEGAILVMVILFLFLGNIRAALITALVIPLSMLMTITGMVHQKVSGNLMSLGALDFGLIVDGAVIIVENCMSKLAHTQMSLGRMLTVKERMKVVFEATKEVRKATMFGEAIITIVYIPIFTLSGIEGKMFQPMAFTVVTALLAAMILSITFVPAMTALCLSGKITEKENILIIYLKKVYEPILAFSLAAPKKIITASVLFFLLSIGISLSLGREFIPQLDEGDIALHAMRIPGTSLSQSVAMQKQVEKQLMALPQVKTVFSKVGTSEVASDPMPPNLADTFVILKEREEWPDPSLSKKELLHLVEEHLEQLPGNNYEFTQPIQMRFNELISGVRADVAIKIFGDDMDILLGKANEVLKLIEDIPGSSDARVEQVSGLPVQTVKLDRHKLSRIGLSVQEVQDHIAIAIGGKNVGKIYHGDRRFDLMVRYPESIRGQKDILEALPLPIPDHGDDAVGGKDALTRYISLGSVAHISSEPGPNQISRENGKRRIVVSSNVRGRDLGSFVEEAQKVLAEKFKIPTGYWLSWGGQFEQMISAAKRLRIVIPIALMLIFLLLYSSFGNIKDSCLVFSCVPLALTGGVLAIWLRGISLSISAGVGFIALSGVAVLNGLVLITFVSSLRDEGVSLHESITRGALSRLRPVIMTALVASLGFVPMALATGTGAEVQKPLATVVIGGIISSTLLTLVVLPAIYSLIHKNN